MDRYLARECYKEGVAELTTLLVSYLHRIGRRIAGTGAQDLDLNGDYYILYGRRERNPSAGLLQTHFSVSPNPSISGRRYNPTVPPLPAGISIPVSPVSTFITSTISVSIVSSPDGL